MYGSEVIVLALYDLVLVEIKRIKCGLVYGSVISRVVQVVYRGGGIGRIVYIVRSYRIQCKGREKGMLIIFHILSFQIIYLKMARIFYVRTSSLSLG